MYPWLPQLLLDGKKDGCDSEINDRVWKSLESLLLKGLSDFREL
jgi:hypothetical protein